LKEGQSEIGSKNPARVCYNTQSRRSKPHPKEGITFVITPEKIEAWIEEALERPESANQIIQHIAQRLDELARQNETLRAENIALQSGARVEEYERQIAHLAYQLELVRRQLGGEISPTQVEQLPTDRKAQAATSLLLYDSLGRVLHWRLEPEALANNASLGMLVGDLAPNHEPLRLLAVPSTEELGFVFTSGRIETLPIERIRAVERPEIDSSHSWEEVPIPHEPNAGERLACLAPIAKMALAKYYIQTSRKGCVKKIRTAMGQSILANRYIGPGTRQPPDQPCSLALGNDGERLVLVTHEGYLQCLAVDDLPPAIEEGMRLEFSDHVVGAFIPSPHTALAVMTQVGKVIYWTEDRLETGRTFRSKGQALFTASRREQGVRVVGAGPVAAGGWAFGLHRSGRLSLYDASTILASGAVPVEDELLAFAFFPAPGDPKPDGHGV
jgi:DNA gyrase/topoisomerase IV subunit A